LAEEEEKKVEEEQPAESKKEEEPKKPKEEPEAEKEEAEPPVPPSEAPTVEDIEDVLKEALMEEPEEQAAEAPEAEAPPAAAVEKEIAPPKPDIPLPEEKPEKEEEEAITPEEKQEGGEKLKETPVDEPTGEIKEEPKVMDEPKAPKEKKVEEAVAAQEPEKTEVQEIKAEVPKPKEEPVPPKEVQDEKMIEPEAPKEKEVKKVKVEEPKVPKEKQGEVQVEKAAKPTKEKKVKEEKPKKTGKPDKKAAPEKKPESEKPAPRKAKKPPVESPTMIISPFLFGKFDLREVEVADPGLRKYINLLPVVIPHTGARHANRWLGKTKINIVERLINNMMRTQHSTGKKSFAYKTVNNAFDIIATRTKKNPIQVLVDALQNASPKEEITRLRFGGISVPKAVDTSSSRRLDIALRNICKGTVSSSHRNRKHMEMCLADEIILASKGDMNSYAISKKEESERIAASAR